MFGNTCDNVVAASLITLQALVLLGATVGLSSSVIYGVGSGYFEGTISLWWLSLLFPVLALSGFIVLCHLYLVSLLAHFHRDLPRNLRLVSALTVWMSSLTIITISTAYAWSEQLGAVATIALVLTVPICAGSGATATRTVLIERSETAS